MYRTATDRICWHRPQDGVQLLIASYMKLDKLLDFLNLTVLSSFCLLTSCETKLTHKLPACFYAELQEQAQCLPRPHQTSVGPLFWRNKLFDLSGKLQISFTSFALQIISMHLNHTGNVKLSHNKSWRLRGEMECWMWHLAQLGWHSCQL
jgi:hypothetical protein